MPVCDGSVAHQRFGAVPAGGIMHRQMKMQTPRTP